MRVSRCIAEYLKGKVDYVFGVQGGAVVHLFDACERFGPQPIYCHHEQAAGFAAVSYARTAGYGACIVTTGPGATNALTPLLGAWQNFTPTLFISGQARLSQTSYGTPHRQVGLQEAPILSIVTPITKFTFLVEDPKRVPAQLEYAYDIAMERPSGPVWIDVPLDMQWADV